MSERTCPLCGGNKWVRWVNAGGELHLSCMSRGCGYQTVAPVDMGEDQVR